MPDPWDLLAARMADLRALQGAIAVLSWDHETHMPPKGGAARGEQLAALQGLRHEKLIAPDLGGAIAAAEEAERGAGDPTRTALLRAIRFERDRAIAVPERLVRETAAAQTASVAAWRTARERSDFAAFAPHLENVLALRREAAE
ncbi:MAG: carboxypeptidase M32, partial [Anaeromyxobacteraceae bacterium]